MYLARIYRYEDGSMLAYEHPDPTHIAVYDGNMWIITDNTEWLTGYGLTYMTDVVVHPIRDVSERVREVISRAISEITR